MPPGFEKGSTRREIDYMIAGVVLENDPRLRQLLLSDDVPRKLESAVLGELVEQALFAMESFALSGNVEDLDLFEPPLGSEVNPLIELGWVRPSLAEQIVDENDPVLLGIVKPDPQLIGEAPFTPEDKQPALTDKGRMLVENYRRAKNFPPEIDTGYLKTIG